METDNIAERFVIDVTDFSRYTNGSTAPVWWGIIGLIVIEMSVVSAFVISYFYLQMMNDQWPPESMPLPDVFLPTLSLILLLISCFTMYLASRAINNNRIKRFVSFTLTSVGLACVVLVIRWRKIQQFEFRWDEHVFGSLMWTINGFHFIHVVSAAIGTAVIGLLGMFGYFNKQRQIGVVVDTLYWNFVALAWIPFYFVLYWAPRLL